MSAHCFSHYYSRGCRWMVWELAGVISPSCLDHTNLSIQFRPWNCWGLRWGIDVGPPLFTLWQPGILTDGVRTGWCDQPLMPRSHQTICPVLAVKLLGITLRNRWWPTAFHTITAGDADGWFPNWPVWSAPQSHHLPLLLFTCHLSNFERNLGFNIGYAHGICHRESSIGLCKARLAHLSYNKTCYKASSC